MFHNTPILSLIVRIVLSKGDLSQVQTVSLQAASAKSISRNETLRIHSKDKAMKIRTASKFLQKVVVS